MVQMFCEDCCRHPIPECIECNNYGLADKEDTTSFHQIAGESVVDRDEGNDIRYAEYREKWKSNPERHITGDFPLQLDIEPTSLCNLQCPFCATTINDFKAGFMDTETWKRIVDEAGQHGLYAIKFNYRGEPLLHKQLPEMVKYAKDVGVLDVYFNTNGTMLRRSVIHELIEAGLDRVTISFEGMDKEVYEKYRVGADFDKVVQNISNLKEMRNNLGKKKPLIRIQTVLVPELIGREKEYAAYWSSVVDEVAYLDYKNEADEPVHISKPPCPQLWQRLAITWDGNILPCCHDIYGNMFLGNVKDTSISEAWQSAQLDDYRRLHRAGLAYMIPACNRCPWFA